jgi:hypothetical protein
MSVNRPSQFDDRLKNGPKTGALGFTKNLNLRETIER